MALSLAAPSNPSGSVYLMHEKVRCLSVLVVPHYLSLCALGYL